MLEINSSIVRLDLRNCKLTETSVVALANAIEKKRHFGSLALLFERDEYACSKASMRALCAATKSLRHLQLSFGLDGSRFDRDALLELASAVADNSYRLETLCLERCQCIDSSAWHALFAAFASNTSIRSLLVGEIDTGSASFSALASSLSINSTLSTLDISRNDIAAPIFEQFGGTFQHNSTLKHLNVSFNSIGTSLRAICDAVRTNHDQLLSLDCADADIERGGVVKLLASTTALRTLYVGAGNTLDIETYTTFERNTTLQSIVTDGNQARRLTTIAERNKLLSRPLVAAVIVDVCTALHPLALPDYVIIEILLKLPHWRWIERFVTNFCLRVQKSIKIKMNSKPI
jgi:hypothetical protein